MSSKTVKRITLFKIPKEEDIDGALAQYEILRSTAQKDGKPYIISNEATRVTNSSDERAQGYTMLAVTVFKSREDFDYYDKECAAHKKLREFITPRRTGFATIQYESELGP
ncbi:hypothetical protein G647_07049 [Cladophialophora carrionii CBS 160.54]|uniref:Stress responsive A/B barrel domain protein n=2 Tax=Cladophialophora carrionii TaxID=86049 RepID=A0A1C1C747_9EURO|nr:uncharacterized protein G647_07049 [Cladophialophora carrionii CBS 160.54]ETI20707.1 hypothetical protein G647_07049 [Cladophialophora carrionii CBS 160.54]OCT44354.1 stress responsive A/B barrel domain protein [Cladophialophora carrionii]